MAPPRATDSKDVNPYANLATDNLGRPLVDDQGNPLEWNDGMDVEEDTPNVATELDALTRGTARLRTRQPPAPTRESIREVNEFLKRKEPEIDRLNEEEAERKKAKKAGKQPAKPTAQETAKLNPSSRADTAEDFLARKDPAGPLHCVVSVGDEFNRIGDIFQAPEGYGITLQVNAGRYGEPFFRLIFSIAMIEKSQQITRDVQSKKFSVTWRPGVPINGRWMMNAFQAMTLSDKPQGESPHFASIYKNYRKGDLAKVPSWLLAMAFESGSRSVRDADRQDWQYLPDNVKACLETLFYSEETFTVYVWVKPRISIAACWNQWLGPFKNAVDHQKRPLWQYYDADGAVQCSIEDTPHIDEIGHGMYRKGHDGKTTSYHAFPKRITWDTPGEFGITIAMPVVRDVQYAQNVAKSYSLVPHRVLFRKAPTLPLSKDHPELRRVSNVYEAYVRLMPDPDGNVPPPPKAKEWFTLEWDNSIFSLQKPHEPTTDKRQIWRGSVTENDMAVAATRTHFCLLFEKFYGADLPRQVKLRLEDYPDAQLALAHITLLVDTTAADRELDAALKFADPTYEPKTLGPVRQAFSGDPHKMPNTKTNLAERDPGWWNWWIHRVVASCAGNEKQIEAVTALKEVRDKIVAVVGPPGAGKTSTLSNALWALFGQRYKAMVVGPSNVAVDRAANSAWEKYPPGKKYEGQFKLLRIEVQSAELRAMVKFKNGKEQDPNKVPEVEDQLDIEEDAALHAAMTNAIREYETNNTILRKLLAEKKPMTQIVKALGERDDRRNAQVPFAMTSNYHLLLLTRVDGFNAKNMLEKVKKAWEAPKADASVLKKLLEGPEKVKKDHELYKASASDAISADEVETRLNDGRIPGLEAYNPSHVWTEALENYVAKDGHLSKEEDQKFKRLYIEIMIRVLEGIDCLFTTCNNAGSDLVHVGFRPQVLACDEAGQVNLATLAVILTTFTKWEAVLLYGDPSQLRPPTLSRGFNEFRENAMFSALGMLEEKDFHIIFLDQQYRMPEEVAKWPAAFLYGGKLRNHPKALADNETRQVARKICKEHYGIAGVNGKGSEYWVINVMHGVAREVRVGTSLTNYANAEAITECVDLFLGQGRRASDIAILTYYTGQKYMTTQKLRALNTESQRNWEVGPGEITSVDSYQGRECSIIILDLVVTHLGNNIKQPGAAQDEDDVDSEAEGVHPRARAYTRISAHVRDAHRLCCAVTRAKDCLVVFMQASLLLSTARAKQRKSRAAISDFVKDAYQRGLVCDDAGRLDNSPEGVQMRARWSEIRKQQELQKLKDMQNRVIKGSLQVAKNYKPNVFPKESLPLYQTASGPCTEAINYRPDLQTPRDDPVAPVRSFTGQTQQDRKNKSMAAAKSVAGDPASVDK